MNGRLKELAEQAGLMCTEDVNADGAAGILLWFKKFDLEHFAELVRQDERAVRGAVLRNQDKQIKEMQLTNARLFEKFNKAVLDEREACALLCLELVQAKASGESYEDGTIDCAAAIRARGDK